MSEIIQFPNSRDNIIRLNNEKPIENVENDLGKLIIETPDKINKIIDKGYTQPKDLLLINERELKSLIIDYIIFHLNKAKIIVEGKILFGLQYISDLIFKIILLKGDEIKLIINHPYYTHWMEQGYPKRAGDASVYSYVFRKFDRKSIQKEDYIPFATNAYMEYSKNIDFSLSIGQILPLIGNMTKDDNLLKRGNLRLIKT